MGLVGEGQIGYGIWFQGTNADIKAYRQIVDIFKDNYFSPLEDVVTVVTVDSIVVNHQIAVVDLSQTAVFQTVEAAPISSEVLFKNLDYGFSHRPHLNFLLEAFDEVGSFSFSFEKPVKSRH